MLRDLPDEQEVQGALKASIEEQNARVAREAARVLLAEEDARRAAVELAERIAPEEEEKKAPLEIAFAATEEDAHETSDGMHNVDQVTSQATPAGHKAATPANEPINLSRFYELLQDHANGSVHCKGADSVMLFGSTGVGKSTMLHLLAGAKFSIGTVEIATDESVAGEFGTDIECRLITEMKIPGCVIGKRFVFHVGIVANLVCG